MTVEIDTGREELVAELADNFLKKAKGMRFRESGKMLFKFRERRPVIDMFFVPDQLQLIFLDENREVTEVKLARPWRIYRPSKPAKYLLESFEELDVEKGDKIQFEM